MDEIQRLMLAVELHHSKRTIDALTWGQLDVIRKRLVAFLEYESAQYGRPLPIVDCASALTSILEEAGE